MSRKYKNLRNLPACASLPAMLRNLPARASQWQAGVRQAGQWQAGLRNLPAMPLNGFNEVL